MKSQIKHLIITTLCIAGMSLPTFSTPGATHATEKESIHWISIEKAMELNKTNPKKIYIDFYTDWCGWCKKMDRDCFTDPKVISEMNKDYYAVKFNAETKDKVLFHDVTYNFSIQNGANEFALSMLDGQLSYPTAVILSETQQKITMVPGYQKASFLVEILSYFGNNIHLKLSWDDYEKSLGHKS